jgi:hypothetical protein
MGDLAYFKLQRAYAKTIGPPEFKWKPERTIWLCVAFTQFAPLPEFGAAPEFKMQVVDRHFFCAFGFKDDLSYEPAIDLLTIDLIPSRKQAFPEGYQPIPELIEFGQQKFRPDGKGIGNDPGISDLNVVDTFEMGHEEPALVIIPDLCFLQAFLTNFLWIYCRD